MAQEPAELPDDVLVEVLRRLAPHSVAACRFVCKAWRDAADARLRSHLVSHSVRGIFINYASHYWRWFRDQYRAVYWRGVLYAHCQRGYVMRMSLSNHKYRVIELPGVDESPMHYLGRSMRGVYCALDYHGLQLWRLNESCSTTEWVLEHVINLGIFPRADNPQPICTQWIIQDVNYSKDPGLYSRYSRSQHGNRDAPVEEKYDWNSDEDNLIDPEDLVQVYRSRYYEFLGFHSYKEIVFLNESLQRGVAYHWNSSKFQDLKEYRSIARPCLGIEMYFPYTPCWRHDFPGNELESLLEDKELLLRDLESQVEDDPNFTCTGEYELRKLRGRAKRVKDTKAKDRRRRRVTAR